MTDTNSRQTDTFRSCGFSFDDFVSTHEDRLRDVEPECFGGCQIQRQRDCLDLLDGDIPRLVAFEYLVDEYRERLEVLRECWPVAQQSTRLSELGPAVDAGNFCLRRERRNFLAPLERKRIGEHDHRVGVVRANCG